MRSFEGGGCGSPLCISAVASTSGPAGSNVPVRGASVIGVTISPASPQIFTSGTLDLNASASCAPSPCPPAVAYAWTFEKTLGTLNTTSGAMVQFTAGSIVGAEQLGVNASWQGTWSVATDNVTISSATAGIQLTGVVVSPTSAAVLEGSVQRLQAFPSCQPVSCPASGLLYSWSLNRSLGSISNSTGPNATFTAPVQGIGEVQVTVVASYGPEVQRSSSALTVVAPSSGSKSQPQNSTPPGPTLLGLPEYEAVAILGALGLLALAIVTQALIVRSRRRGGPPTNHEGATESESAKESETGEDAHDARSVSREEPASETRPEGLS